MAVHQRSKTFPRVLKTVPSLHQESVSVDQMRVIMSLDCTLIPPCSIKSEQGLIIPVPGNGRIGMLTLARVFPQTFTEVGH